MLPYPLEKDKNRVHNTMALPANLNYKAAPSPLQILRHHHHQGSAMHFINSFLSLSALVALVNAHGAMVSTGPGANGVAGRGLGSSSQTKSS
jgi:hypothetical protein